MGVHGLTTFISHYREKYKETVYIRDVPVLIDGCNLMYYLYFDGQNSVVSRGPKTRSSSGSASSSKKLPHAHLFCGDWEQYAQNVRYFFQQMKQCGILSVVLFDGAYNSSKLEVAKHRFAKTVSDNVRNGDGKGAVMYPGKTYTPIFLKTVFLEVLTEQKILHYQTIGEADQTIAFIAHLLKDCPILSCDSDFYIYINAKMIPLQNLKFSKAKLGRKARSGKDATPVPIGSDKVWTLQGEFISLDKLCKNEFKLKNARLLGLAAVILGNDVIQHKVFKNFQSGGGSMNLKERITCVMKWLAKENSMESAIEALLDFVPVDKRKETETLMQLSMQIYEGEDGEISIWNKLKEDSDLSEYIDKDIEARVIGSEVAVIDLPEWYIKGHVSCQYQSYLLNLYKNKIVFFVPQVEMFDEQCSHQFSLPIIQVTAGILISSSTQEVEVMTHRKGKLFKQTVNPVIELKNCCEFPLLLLGTEQRSDNLSKVNHENRMSIIKAALAISENNLINSYFQVWPASCRIWMATLLYYSDCLINSKRLEIHESLAIIVSIFLCIIKNLIVNPGKSVTNSSDNVKFSALSNLHISTSNDTEILHNIRNFYRKYEDHSEVTGRKFMRSYDIRIPFCLGEYLNIVYHTEMLNNLLEKPFKTPNIRYTMNNYFVYKFSHDTIENVVGYSEDDKITQLIADASTVEEVRDLIVEFLDVVYPNEL